jgi:hypothetical protein
MVATDPVYLVEPEIISKNFRLSRTPLDYRAGCVTGYEGWQPGDPVPHYAPDKNPFADEFVKLYHLPREAVLRARLSRDALSGVPEENQRHLRPSAAVHRVVRRCR